MKRVKILKDYDNARLTRDVNIFLQEIDKKFEVLDIKYEFAGTRDYAFICVIIVYTDK